MTDLERLVVRSGCTDLIMRYALAVNDWDIDAFVSLFAEEAVWQRPGTPALRGQRAIRDFMNAQPTDRTVRHVNGGVLIEAIDADTANAWSQTTVYEAGGTTIPAPATAPDMVVEYRDRLARRPGGWCFARRDTTVVFSRPRPAPGAEPTDPD